jgi:uncharacterized phage protein gp47/JayE
MGIPTNINELYIPGSTDEICDFLVEDYRLALLDKGVADPPVFEGTEVYIRFKAIANMTMMLFANIKNNALNANEQTATGEELDNIREGLGLSEKSASPGSGQILPKISGDSAVIFVDNLEFLTNKGLRGKIDGSQTIRDGYVLNTIMIDVGTTTNLSNGDVVNFINPPINVSAKATVYSDFTGGSDNESDSAKQARILSYRQNPPASGSWSDAKKLAESSDSSIQVAFVYPALGGSGSAKIVLCRELSKRLTNIPTRMLPISVIDNVITSIQTEYPSGIDILIQSVVDQPVDICIRMQLNVTSGAGWLDRIPFTLNTQDGYVYISTINGPEDINITSSDGSFKSPPIIGQKIVIYNPILVQFEQKIIITCTYIFTDTYRLTFSPSLVQITAEYLGYFVSPACNNYKSYLTSIYDDFNLVGCGENTEEEWKILNDRSLRKPSNDTEWFNDIGSIILTNLNDNNAEIRNISWGYRSMMKPTTPISVSIAPNILVPRNIGFYKIT